MKKVDIIRFALVFGGGFLVFMLLKKKDGVQVPTDSLKKNFADPVADTAPPTDKQLADAEIVASAYMDAMDAGENASVLSELNRECIQEYGLRSYLKDQHLIVCDVNGKQILVK